MPPLGRLRFICCALFVILLSSTPFSAAQSSSTTGVQAMNLVSNQSGWLLAGGHLFWTDTLGSQWTEITPTVPASSSIDGVFFRADGSGWALLATPDGSSLSVAATSDHGAHWSYNPVLPPFTDASPFGGNASLFFVDGQHGWMMLSVQSSSAFRLGLLLQTTDGGAHWTPEPNPPVGGNLYFVDATRGFIGPGPAGDELYQTLDGGLTWARVTLPVFSANLTGVASTVTLPSFTDSLHGTLLRTYQTDSGATVIQYQTSDGGQSWTATAAPVQATPSSIAALTADGKVTRRITAVASHADIAAITPAAVGQVLPTRSTFSTPSQGWVLFSGGNCNAAQATCTQTSALMGTTDGGQTFFSLGKIPGISLQTTSTFPTGRGESPTNSRTAEGIQPQSSYPTLGAGGSNPGVMGFDACTLPTTAQMSTWHTSSPYQVAGVYLGGENFACSSDLSSLTSSYVSTILTQGWQIIPIWVGLQGAGACSGSCSTMSTTPATAQQQGATEADSAVAAMAALGIGQGSPIVYDMEAYSYTNSTDLAATQAFLEGWTTELHAEGYLSAVYSSHPEFDTWIPGDVTPSIDIIWFAYFFSTGVACGTECQTVFPTQTSSFDLPANYWLNNHRARQTSSGFEQTYGSVKIDIDEDWVDASMVVATPNTLTVTKTGNGAVASTQISNGLDTTLDTAISCGDSCSSTNAHFASTDILTLVATPDSGNILSSWTGCTSTSGNTCTVDVTSANTAVTAAFSVAYTLTVAKSGTGTGTVASSDSTIACGSTCSNSYASGTTVTLTATPAAGSVFSSWIGCTSSSGNTCNVTLSAATSVTANFSTAYSLTVNKAGTGSGTVTSGDSTISCGLTCSASYASGTSVTLTAAPASGSVFSSWTGCTSSSGNTCTVTVAAATTVTATFNTAVTNYTLTVDKAGTGSGTVTSSDSDISCGSICSASYASGTAVTLTATPATGSVFGSWSGCTSSSGATCTVALSAAATVTATFNTAASPTFTAVVSTTALSVTAGANATDTLTITPQSGYSGTFTSFSCTGLPSGASCSFSPTTLTASGNGAALTTTLTLSTTTTVGQVVFTRSRVLFAGLLLPSLLLPFALRRKDRACSRRLLLFGLAAIALTLTPFLNGCGGSSGQNSPSGPTTVFNGTVNASFSSSTGTTQLPIQLTITN